jgi:hypothetical protein
VAIAPGELDGIGADWVHALELEIGRKRFGPEDSLTGPLVSAASTWALGAEEQVGKAIDLGVGPRHFQNLLALEGSDVAGTIGHAFGSGSENSGERWLIMIENNKDSGAEDRSSTHFYVRAPSVNAVRRALHRAPGGARVVGRFDRETIECQHTMDGHSYRRHWPVIASRLEKSGLIVVEGKLNG